MRAVFFDGKATNESGIVPSKSRYKAWLLTILKIGLSVLAVGIVVSTVDLTSAWQRAATQNLWLVLAAAGTTTVQIAIGGFRWHVILRRLGVPATLQDSLRVFYIAAFFNACLWGAISGDVVRTWLSSRARGDIKSVIFSVVLDRIAALAGVAILVLVTAPLFITRVGSGTIALLPLGLAAAGLMGIGFVAQLDRLPVASQQLRVVRLLHALGGATGAVFLNAASAIPALGLAVLAQIAMAISAYAVSASLQINLTLLDCLVLMQPVALISAVPISVGGWGVREGAMIGLLSLVGVPASAALVLSVQIGLLTVLVSLPGGVLWLLLRSTSKEVAP
jgi:glycosyltransferase 2 family protein